MPGKVKVKIISGRNLPVMDRSSDTTDAYVEIKLGTTTYKTDVCRKSLHPQWNSEWYRFEVDDSELQDEPLQIRLMDHDTYSANDAIGKVYLDLNPLLLPAASLLAKYTEGTTMHEGSSSSLTGWIPVYDTMHGIRGEVNIIVKVELFTDFNKFRQSSCGVHFFCSPTIPHGFYALEIHGFVEELVVNSDPEYQWIDKIRTPRASNEARQTLFFKLSGELQRKIGVKALDLGGNAVIGYKQAFDLEGDSGIVARGIGTAVTLIKINDAPLSLEHRANIDEKRAQNYLKFLGCAASFFLNNNSTKPLTNHQRNPQFLSINNPYLVKPIFKPKPVSHDEEFNSLLKQQLVHHSTSLQTLLKQEDMRCAPSKGISQRCKNFMYLSQSMLSKRIIPLKGKLGNEKSVNPLNRKDKPNLFEFRRTRSDSGRMAQILVKSIGYATSSLNRVSESPKRLLQDNDLKLEPLFSEASEIVESQSTETDSSVDDDIDDDTEDKENECEFKAKNELEEFDTISQVVENARKLSMVQSVPTSPFGGQRQRNFFIFRDDLEENTKCEDNTNDISETTVSQSFIAPKLIKSSTSHCLFDSSRSIGHQTKFTSLHDIHRSFSKVNKYSVHNGKETVLGELFRHVELPKAKIYSEKSEIHGSIVDVNKKNERSLFYAPKVLFRRLDSKIHNTKSDTESHDRNKHGLLQTALKNVLMESANEILATTHGEKSNSTQAESHENFPPLIKSKSALIIDSNITNTESSTSQNTSSDESRPSTFDKSTNSKKLQHLSLLERSKAFLIKLDAQLHKKATIQNSDGLLQTALKNVLIDRAQEVLATSHVHSSTSQLNNPCISYNLEANNTGIESGINTKTLHAYLTQPRNENATSDGETDRGHQRAESLGVKLSHSPATLNSISSIHRRSSDSDLSITPKGNSLTGSDKSGYAGSQFEWSSRAKTNVIQENFDIMEYPFLTMTEYPPGFIVFIGGAVSARSVKLLERITNIEEPESRDTWWSEIRMEIRSHARALNCNAVLGYVELTSICEDVCVLSASGTAAIIGHQNPLELVGNAERDSHMKSQRVLSGDSPEKGHHKNSCYICHLPYTTNTIPLRQSFSKCNTCRSFKVPDMLLATIEIPEGIPSMGRGCFIQSYVCRPLRDLKGESNAKEISDGLPFLEYELHRYLINKLKVKGMNAIFGLKVRISVGERMLIGIATGTAMFLAPLSAPPLPKLVSDRTADDKKLAQLQKSLHDTDEYPNGKKLSDTDDSEDESVSLDLSAGNKDCCILEVDDPEDVDVLNSLMEPRPPDGFHVVNTEFVPGLEDLEIVKNLQMFKQIWRAKMQPYQHLEKHFHRLLQSVYFKLRRMIPCALCDLQFRVDSPEPDEVQICVLGMALGLGDMKTAKGKRKCALPYKRNNADEDLIFNLEEDRIPEHSVAQTPPHYLHAQSLKFKQKSPCRSRLSNRQRHVPYRERHGVDITPLSYVPGGKIEKYLGNLNFFFIRETMSLREEGGLSGFIHSFIAEVLAIVRAHVTALGGNAMVAYFITECVLSHNLHKNQGHCLINVGGDVVYVSYFTEDN